MALTIANFTVPQCRQFYQFLLSQAILYGIGSGFLYTPCLAIISHYFDKKRPIAYAIVTAGGAIGGVLYPIMFRRLEPNIGFPWTMRIFGFLQLFIFVLGIMVLFDEDRRQLAQRRIKRSKETGSTLVARSKERYSSVPGSTLVARSKERH
ncbi:major facilitator superfamily domain-containing protein [Rhodocollybia butyracea]|uniref:Major facilitator superfamily domain-containing protein n=1 Tax=Rhodocollybia butyracea TaxID=206335 RepID=A0A9P5P4Q4_9AGAR|nr:major facilitator superfamily domain-containing protein [Rhodocollybia butyracea]